MAFHARVATLVLLEGRPRDRGVAVLPGRDVELAAAALNKSACGRGNDDQRPGRISGRPRDRLPGQGTGPTDELRPAVHSHSHRYPAGSRHQIHRSLRLGELCGRVRRDRLLGDGGDAPIPPEVPTLVVRLEPGLDALRRTRLGVSRAAAGHAQTRAPKRVKARFQSNHQRGYFWNLALTRFGARVWAYLALLRDEYPSTDDEQAVHIEI